MLRECLLPSSGKNNRADSGANSGALGGGTARILGLCGLGIGGAAPSAAAGGVVVVEVVVVTISSQWRWMGE